MLTFCIPSKNNLRYLKVAVNSIEKNSYYIDNEILVFVDQDNDGTIKWLKENKINYLENKDAEPKGIGYAYDLMFKKAKFDLVVAFHADMVLGYHADYWMHKFKAKDNVVCATRIEPPLHPPGPEKIVRDFGIWPEDIKMEEFNIFVKDNSHNFKVSKGMFAPWMIEKKQHLGHDPIFKSVYEDADLFRRFVLAGYKMVQTWDALVYHLTCRGGQFAGAEKMEDFQKKDPKWVENNVISMKEYIRKWGGLFKEYGPCEPRPNKKYNIGLEIINQEPVNILNLSALEPYFDNINVADNPYAKSYINNFQHTTSFSLTKKFVKDLSNDIIIKIDTNNVDLLSPAFLEVINNLEDILEPIKEPGDYETNGIIVSIKKLEVKNPKIKLV